MIGSPVEVSPVLRLHTLTRGFFAAGRALLQRSSRAILQTALHVGPFGGVCLAFLVNLFVVCVLVFWCVHGVIVSFLAHFTLRSRSWWWGGASV
jgi:hypothetical protein